MNLNHLRHFFTVIERGSFSDAADRLYISQPAVSKSVNELESYLKLPLIERGVKGRPLSLTKDGKMLYDYARSIFALEKAATDEVIARQKLNRGAITIGVSPTIANYWLTPYLVDFQHKYPDIDLKVMVESTHTIKEALTDAHIDIALVEGGQIESEQYDIKIWKQEVMSIIAHPDIDDKEWHKHPWLLRERGSMTRDLMDQLLVKAKITPKKIIEVGSNELIAQMVSKNFGLGILPRSVIHSFCETKQLKEISRGHHDMLTRPLYWIVCHGRPLGPASRAFHDVLFN